MDGLKDPGDLYLFFLAAIMGNLGPWMMWRGLQQSGFILTVCSAVLLAIFLGSLEDDEEGDQAEG